MIEIYKEWWTEIPVLIVVDPNKKEKKLPVLTYFHGFTSAKEHNLPLAYLLAEKGYRVVLPDSMLHGERANDRISNDDMQLQFFNIVEQNIKDLAYIRNELLRKDLIKDDRFGVAGTSMGGITTAASLTKYPWITAAAVLMGSPKITAYAKELVYHMKETTGELPLSEQQVQLIFQALEQIDLSLQMEKLNERPMLFWHGESDPIVPFEHAYSFYEEVTKLYKNPENIRFLREVNRGHKVSRFAILETVNWFEMQL